MDQSLKPVVMVTGRTRWLDSVSIASDTKLSFDYLPLLIRSGRDVGRPGCRLLKYRAPSIVLSSCMLNLLSTVASLTLKYAAMIFPSKV